MVFNLALVLGWIIYKQIWDITNLFQKQTAMKINFLAWAAPFHSPLTFWQSILYELFTFATKLWRILAKPFAEGKLKVSCWRSQTFFRSLSSDNIFWDPRDPNNYWVFLDALASLRSRLTRISTESMRIQWLSVQDSVVIRSGFSGYPFTFLRLLQL